MFKYILLILLCLSGSLCAQTNSYILVDENGKVFHLPFETGIVQSEPDYEYAGAVNSIQRGDTYIHSCLEKDSSSNLQRSRVLLSPFIDKTQELDNISCRNGYLDINNTINKYFVSDGDARTIEIWDYYHSWDAIAVPINETKLIDSFYFPDANSKFAFAVDHIRNRIYYQNSSNQLKVFNLAGESFDPAVYAVSAGLMHQLQIDFRNSKIYWLDKGDNTIKRVSLDGTAQENVYTRAAEIVSYALSITFNKLIYSLDNRVYSVDLTSKVSADEIVSEYFDDPGRITAMVEVDIRCQGYSNFFDAVDDIFLNAKGINNLCRDSARFKKVKKNYRAMLREIHYSDARIVKNYANKMYKIATRTAKLDRCIYKDAEHAADVLIGLRNPYRRASRRLGNIERTSPDLYCGSSVQYKSLKIPLT